jgi:DNA polymerase-3 subunit delta
MRRQPLTWSQFRQGLKRGGIEPVYLLAGEEEFFHEEAMRLLQAACLGPDDGGMNRDRLRGDETDVAAILDLASTYPMGGATRLIIVRGADALRLDDPKPLAAYLAAPNPRTCLVFSDPQFDRRRSLFRVLQENAAVILCDPLDEPRLAAWVRERLAEDGYGLESALAEAIATALSAAGLARVDAELAKLRSAIGAPRPVRAADLSILADAPRLEDAFRMAAAVARGSRGEALPAARDLLRAGEEPLQLLGALSWYFRNALRARLAQARRLPPREVTALYGLDPGRVDRFRRDIGAATAASLRRALGLCLQADRELKGMGAKDPAHALERLIHRAGRGVAADGGRS